MFYNYLIFSMVALSLCILKKHFVSLDKIYHVDNRFINRDTLEDQRLFSLSDYGFYMLIFKLSIHFSRIQEKVNRGCIAN